MVILLVDEGKASVKIINSDLKRPLTIARCDKIRELLSK